MPATTTYHHNDLCTSFNMFVGNMLRKPTLLHLELVSTVRPPPPPVLTQKCRFTLITVPLQNCSFELKESAMRALQNMVYHITR